MYIQCDTRHSKVGIQNTKGKQIDFLFKPNIIGENRRGGAVRGKKPWLMRAHSILGSMISPCRDSGKKSNGKSFDSHRWVNKLN